MANVVVCDDSPSERETIHRTVSMIAGVQRVFTASSAEEALAIVEKDRPEIVLMDVRMPGIGGIEATRRIAETHPEIAVIMLASQVDADGAGQAVEFGARGYIAKDAAHEEMVALLSLVLGSRVATGRTARVLEGPRPTLSEREHEVLDGLARGLSNYDIGKELFLSEDTVKTHARRLYRKLGAADRAQAVANGFRWGILH